MSRPGQGRGFTLVEILIVLAIVVILAGLAVGAYDRYREKVRVSQAVSDIGAIATSIKLRAVEEREFPGSLAEIGLGGKLDPWGRPYQYLNLETKKGNGMARKDKKLAPLNSDFDLYSMGPDGQTQKQLTAAKARDDIVRANNGAFIGVAANH